ncbi:hypothetical protein TrLO_g1074 [Triparma laevis f. longispina]|uniref:HVA22-like protein n=1 Tax=Triparma laevis f. longispina TaxID=1714387 RepID=A0A9W6ZYU6_9STRA|nr:hypothetical protein TrLO_g1074 [Triparma laevis f. longispina]
MIPTIILSFGTHILQLYAALSSFRALQSEDSSDDKQWLTFWLLFTLFEITVSILDILAIYIVPFYGEIKFGFILFIGVFGGAGKIYPMLEPILLKAEKVAEKYEAIAKEEIGKATKKLK